MISFLKIFAEEPFFDDLVIYNPDDYEEDAKTNNDDSRLTEKNLKFLEVIKEYKDKIEYTDDGKIEKVISYDGSYDVFIYGDFSQKIERIDSYDRYGNHTETTIFYRDSITGQLLGYNKTTDKAFFYMINKNNDVFLKGNRENFNTYNTFFSSLVITTNNSALNFSYDENSNLVIKNKDGKVTMYNQSGKIIQNGDTKYEYDGQNLIGSKTFSGDNVIQEVMYEDSKEKEIKTYDNNILVKVLSINSDGNIEKRYEGGILYATIYYYPDNKKVKKIEYASV